MRVTLRLRKLVGPGAADFFRDACALMDDPLRFSSTSHLVGHLMRETESALRDVLQPLAQVAETVGEPTKKDKQNTQKFEITSILTLLDIPLNNEVAKKWLSQAGTYHTKAHREDLGAPRPLEASLGQFFDDFEGILDYVLDRMEANYSLVFVTVDALAIKSPATSEDISVLLNHVPRDVIAFDRFFNAVTDPSWLSLLREHEMFSYPPDPEMHEDDGTVSFPPWPQMKYLIRIASELPDDVAKIVENIPPTSNIFVNAAIVDVATTLPIERAVSLLPRLLVMISIPYRMGFPVRLPDLIRSLLNAGELSSAMELAQALLSFEETPEEVDDSDSELSRSLREPLLRVDEYVYTQILQRQIPGLIHAMGIPAIQVLADLLEEAIVSSSSNAMIEAYQDFSSTWRREIVPVSLNYDHGIKSHLVSAIRDGSVARVNIAPEELRAIIDFLEARQWSVFQRLALHLLTIHGSQELKAVEERLIQPALFENQQLKPEYDCLLAAHFRAIDEQAKLAVLSMIDHGPDIERHSEWVREMSGRDPTEGETKNYVETWQLERLIPIADQLPEDWSNLYQRLVKEHGLPTRNSDLVGGGFVGARSPATLEELSSLDVDALVDYLASFDPSGDPFGRSTGGLASTLTEVVAADANRLLTVARKLGDLDVAYAHGALNGVIRSVHNGINVDWVGVLELCETIVAHPRGALFDEIIDNGWGWARLDVVRLLESGFSSAHPLTDEYRDRVFSIIEAVADDPHPTQSDEDQFGPPNMGPDDLALNSVRSRGIEAAIFYGVWVYRQHPEDSFHEVLELLDKHLDTQNDPSVAVRSVIGTNFSNLVAFDRSWAERSAERIFPADAELRHLWAAAWDSYLWRGLQNKPTWLALQGQYALAVHRVEPGSEERTQHGRDEALTNHLVSLYWAGEIGLENGLLADLLIVADEGLRRSVLEAVGRGLTPDGPPLEDSVLQRLLALWNSRVDAVRSKPSGELSAFGRWFCSSQILLDVRVQGLRDALALSGHAEPAHQVVEQLAAVSSELPREAAELLGRMAEREDDGWRFTLWDESASQIIKASVASGDPEAIRLTSEAASRAAARGHSRWLEFLEKP